jgi:hypothetical protein
VVALVVGVAAGWFPRGAAEEAATPPPAPTTATRAAAIGVVGMTRVTDPALVGDFVLPPTVDHARVRAFLDRQDSGVDIPDDEYGEFLTDIGAVTSRVMMWRVTLEGRRETEVVVTGMRPVRTGPCTPPLGSSMIENPAAGSAELITFTTDIDRPRPRFARLDVLTGAETDFFASSVLKLPRGEQNVIHIRATTAGPTCSFHVELTYQADGRPGRLRLTAPGGRPFQVTGAMPFEDYEWVYMSPLHGCEGPSGRFITPRVPGAAYGTCPRGPVT